MQTSSMAVTREELVAGPTIRSIAGTFGHVALARHFAAVIGFFFLCGLAAAALMRLELLAPAGWLLSSDAYNKLFSLHGMMMVYFGLLPAFPAVLGLCCLPALVGSTEFVFPRLNRLAWFLFTAGGLITLLSALRGGADAGWSFTAPYSLLSSQGSISMAGLGVLLAALSYALLAVNIVATVHARSDRERPWTDLPMLAIGLYAGSLTLLLAAPVLCMAMVLLLVNRFLPFQLFDPAMGGDPVVFNHLFWFAATPAFYAMILPAAGAISDVLPHYAQRPLATRRWCARAMLLAAALSFFLWGQHLLTSDASPARAGVATLLSHLMAAPFIVLLLSWMITLARGQRSTKAPYLFSVVFLVLLVGGGLTGLLLASPALNPHLHNTLFVVAHIHVVLVGGVLTALLAALHHWWTDLTRRPAPEFSAKVAAVMMFAGVVLTFLPLFVAGYLGLPRREHFYPQEFQVSQVLATAGASILIVALLVATGGLVGSLFRQKRA